MREGQAAGRARPRRAGRTAPWLAALCLAAGPARAQISSFHVVRIDPAHGMTFALDRGSGDAPAWTCDIGFRAGTLAGRDPDNWIGMVFAGSGDFGGVRVEAGDSLRVYGIRGVSLLAPDGFAAALAPDDPGYALHDYAGYRRIYGPDAWTASTGPMRRAVSLDWGEAVSGGFAPRGAWLAFQAVAAAAGADWRGTPHPQWGRFVFDPVVPQNAGPVYLGMHVLADVVTKQGTVSGRSGFVRLDSPAADLAPEAPGLLLLLGGLLPLAGGAWLRRGRASAARRVPPGSFTRA